MNNSNNNNNNNNNERLFWLVFHNKFLLNKIINYIQSIEWVIYNDHSQLHIDNRLKFKNIHSLEWMLENKQYQLLNNKLDNNDIIEIDKSSITLLFNQLSIENIKTSTSTSTSSTTITIIIKELLIKLLSKKRNEKLLNGFEITLKNSKYQNEMKEFIVSNNLPIKLDFPPPPPPSTLNTSFENIKNIMKLSYEEIYEIIDKTSLSSLSSLSLKELQRISIINLNQLGEKYKDVYYKSYKDYFIMYNETIDECHSRDIEKYKELKESSEKQEEFLKFLEFFKLNDILRKRLIDKDSIIKDFKNGNLVWNEILNEIIIKNYKNDEEMLNIVIYDKSIIDWLLNCKTRDILEYWIANMYDISYGTLELADYVYKLNLLSHLTQNDDESFNNSYYNACLYYHVWKQAIKEADFKTINYIESIGNDVSIHQLNLDLYEIYSGENNLSKNQIIKLINGFNETGFSRFSSDNLELFIDRVADVFGDHDKSNIKLNFSDNQFRDNIGPLLEKSINQMNLKKLEFILINSNIFDDGVMMIDEPFEIINHLLYDRILFNKNRKLVYFEESKATRFEIIELIKKIVRKGSSKCYKFTTSNDGYSVITPFVNGLFERLISIKGITMNEIKPIYQLIQDNSIEIYHDFYHSFWYLNIKDCKFTYYITSLNFTKSLFYSRDDSCYYNCIYPLEDYKKEEFIYLEDYLNSSEHFTFESINKLSFDSILDIIINGLSTFPDDQTQLNNLLNFDLEFYLIIRRIDLFFKKLQQIKTITSSSSFNISRNVIKFICKILNLNEILDIINFNIFQSSLQTELIYHSFENYRFDIISKLLLQNNDSKLILEIPLNRSFIFENYIKLIKQPYKFKIIEEQEEQVHKDDQQIYYYKFNQLEDDLFYSAFIKGDIEECIIILSNYPNYNFKITKQLISHTIENNNVGIIAYFFKTFKNGYLFNKDDHDLINHLNLELKNHNRYFN